MPTVRYTKTSILVAEREQKRTRPLYTKVSVLVAGREQKRTLPRLTKTSVLVAQAITTTTVEYLRVTAHYDEVVYEPPRPEVKATSHYLEVIQEPEFPEYRTTAHYLEVVLDNSLTTTTTTTTTTAPFGTVVFGHHTSVDEEYDENLTGNWSGSASIIGSGDSEYLRFYAGQSKILNSPWNIGTGLVKLQLNKYNTGDNVSIYYKDGSSLSNCEADTWKRYSSYFTSSGWVQVKLQQGSTTTTTTTTSSSTTTSTTTTSTTFTTTTTTVTTTTSPPVEIWNNYDVNTQNWGYMSYTRNFRILLQPSDLTGGGKDGQIRILLAAHTSGDCDINGASIGLRSGSTDDFISTPTRITFDGDSNTTTLYAGVDKYSDWIDYDLDPSKDHLVHLTASGYGTYCYSVNTNYRQDTATDYTMTTSVSFSSVGYSYLLDTVEIMGAVPYTTTTTTV
jgi:hypothetical protein